MNKRLSVKILSTILIILVSGCSSDRCGSTSVTENNLKDIETLRTEAQELSFMACKAGVLKQNEQGYWEATLNNGMILIYVPKGSFTMGNNELEGSSPAHKVYLSHYWISKTPVTIGQFRAFIEATNYITDVEKPDKLSSYVYDFSEQGFVPKKGYRWDNTFRDIIAKYPELKTNEQHPVNSVSWNDAIAYTDWLKKINHLEFSLPTEAEWEFAARGSDGRIYPWGNESPDGQKANYADEMFDKYFPNTEQSIVHKKVKIHLQ